MSPPPHLGLLTIPYNTSPPLLVLLYLDLLLSLMSIIQGHGIVIPGLKVACTFQKQLSAVDVVCSRLSVGMR